MIKRLFSPQQQGQQETSGPNIGDFGRSEQNLQGPPLFVVLYFVVNLSAKQKKKWLKTYNLLGIAVGHPTVGISLLKG